MPKRISDLFNISCSTLRTRNVFNGFVDIDSSFYIDPRLLKTTAAPELKNSYEKVENYFRNILHAIAIGENLKEVAQMLVFPEIPLVGLGYSGNHNKGKGIGSGIALKLAKTAIELVSKGIDDPVIFELSEVFESHIGADRISDMLAHILRHNFVAFSRRVASELNLPKSSYATSVCGEPFYELPYADRGVLFIPEDILTDLPLSTAFSASDSIFRKNSELRGYVNQMLKRSWNYSPNWKEVLDKKNKVAFRKTILEKPALMSALIGSYKSVIPEPYDFEKDLRRHLKWHDNVRLHIKGYSLEAKFLEVESYHMKADVLCSEFCNLVKERIYPEFYLPSKNLVSEKIGQLILWEFVCSSNAATNYDSKTGVITLWENNCTQSHQILFVGREKGLATKYKKIVQRINRDSAVISFNIILLKAESFLEGKAAINGLQRTFQREKKKVPKIFIADASRASSRSGSRKSRKKLLTPQFNSRGKLVGFVSSR